MYPGFSASWLVLFGKPFFTYLLKKKTEDLNISLYRSLTRQYSKISLSELLRNLTEKNVERNFNREEIVKRYIGEEPKITFDNMF